MRQLLLLCLLCTLAFAEPAFNSMFSRFNYCGAESSALGESGVAFSSMLGTSLLNPANSVLYGNEQDVSIAFTSGVGYLDKDTIENVGINGLVGYFPTFKNPDIRMGILLSNFNHDLQMNDNIMATDGVTSFSLGKSIFDHKNNTATTSVSLAWKDYVSFGLGVQVLSLKSIVKFHIDPDYVWILGTDYMEAIEEITEPSIDLGFRTQYPFHFSNSFFIKPSIGFSAIRLGNDSIVVPATTEDEFDYKVNLSTFLNFGTALTMGKENTFWGTFLFDSHRELLEKDIITRSIGLQLGFTPVVQINGGYLNDSDSLRKEVHIGATVGYRSRQMEQYLLSKGRTPTTRPKLHNVQVLYSVSLINDLYDDDDIERGGQHVHQLTCAVGLNKRKAVAEYKAKNKKFFEKPAPTQELMVYSYEEIELELVE